MSIVAVTSSVEVVSRRPVSYSQTAWGGVSVEPFCSSEMSCSVVDGRKDRDLQRCSVNLRKLEEISGFEDDWNGYGAKPLNPELIDLARQFVLGLKVQPELFPTADGSIQVEWEKPSGDYLEIQITLNDELRVFRIDSEQCEAETMVKADIEHINKVVFDFYAGV